MVTTSVNGARDTYVNLTSIWDVAETGYVDSSGNPQFLTEVMRSGANSYTQPSQILRRNNNGAAMTVSMSFDGTGFTNGVAVADQGVQFYSDSRASNGLWQPTSITSTGVASGSLGSTSLAYAGNGEPVSVTQTGIVHNSSVSVAYGYTGTNPTSASTSFDSDSEQDMTESDYSNPTCH
jgi:hypothetical protein